MSTFETYHQCPICLSFHRSSDLPNNLPPPPPPPIGHGGTYSYVPLPTPVTTSSAQIYDQRDRSARERGSSSSSGKTFINSLQKNKLVINSSVLKQLVIAQSCAICLDEFKLEEGVNQLPCRHWLHHDCIKKWLRFKNNCPMCRHEFPREPDHHVSSQSRRRIRYEPVILIPISENSMPSIIPPRHRTARISTGDVFPNRRLAER